MSLAKLCEEAYLNIEYWIQCERLILRKEALFEFNSDRCSISLKSSLELLQIPWTLLSWIHMFQENEAPGLFSKLVLPKLQNYISKKILYYFS